MELSLLAKLVDDYVAKREERLAADKVATKLKTQETKLKTELLEQLTSNEVGSVGGSTHRVTKQVKRKPQVVDWGEFGQYLLQNQALELLQKRLNEGAIAEHSEQNPVPGIDYYEVLDLSVAKL